MHQRILWLLPLPFLLANDACQPGELGESAHPAEGDVHDGEYLPVEVAECVPARTLSCGDVVRADNGDWNAGATDALDFYEGIIGNYEGPELAFRFDAQVARTVSFTLVDPEPSVLNQDLFVLEDLCHAGSTEARGFNSVDVDVQAGREYFVVVDGYHGAAGDFELRVDCDEPFGDVSDPFAPQPDTSEGLVNVSADLEELMEFGLLDFACDDWEADPTNREAMLACGKWRFFYEPMGTDGIPEPLFDWVGRNFPDFAGSGFTRFGMIQDPLADKPRPLGFGDTEPFGLANAVGMTCASCHFGQLPDGRYAVGYPNHRYDYGTHMLSIMVGVKAAVPGFDPADHHPDAIDALQPMLDRFAADPMLAAGFAMNMVSLLPSLGDVPEVPYEAEGQYASWREGTMDFLIAPLSADDGVHTVSRISPLWGIPTVEESQGHGAAHAMLGWTGGTRSIEDFARAFVHVGGGDVAEWPDEQLAPLAEYIKSLRAPQPLTAPSGDVARGERVFADAGCQDCHGGPRGGGLEIYRWEEIGTDDALRDWGAPDGDGELCCGLSDYDNSYDTGGVKAPRLVGLHTFERFLHNGALDSLEQLFCLESRPASDTPPFAARGHEYGCDSLSVNDREALIAFLKTL